MAKKAALVSLALLLAIGAMSGIAPIPTHAAAAITISPTAGPPGTEVTVNGSGFAAGETGIVVTYGGSPVRSGIAAADTGDWTATFQVPQSASGPYVVGAYGTRTPAVSVGTVSFIVTPALRCTRAVDWPAPR